MGWNRRVRGGHGTIWAHTWLVFQRPRQDSAAVLRHAREVGETGAAAGVWAQHVRARDKVIRSASNPTDLWGPRVGAKN
jgi:hypothetical protein